MWKSNLLTPCKSSNGSIGRSEGSNIPFVTYKVKIIVATTKNKSAGTNLPEILQWLLGGLCN
jgi:hypothetical protein